MHNSVPNHNNGCAMQVLFSVVYATRDDAQRCADQSGSNGLSVSRSGAGSTAQATAGTAAGVPAHLSNALISPSPQAATAMHAMRSRLEAGGAAQLVLSLLMATSGDMRADVVMHIVGCLHAVW